MCCFDLETNSSADHSKNIGVYNNLIDYEDAAFDAVGNALCLKKFLCGAKPRQGHRCEQHHHRRSRRRDSPLYDERNFSRELKKCEIVNNYIFRTGQNAIRACGRLA